MHKSCKLLILVLDSSGEKKSGFMIGNNNWIGSREQCYYTNNIIPITINKQPGRFNRTMKPDLFHNIAPFQMTFKIVHAQHYSPLQVQYKVTKENILNIGLCVPATCSNEEINAFTQSYFDSEMTDQYNNLELQAQVLEVKDMQIRNGFFYKKSVLTLFGIMLIIFCLTRLASTFDIMENHPDDIEGSKNVLHQIIDCFNYSKNEQQLVSQNVKSNAIPTIDGIRYYHDISVVFSHTYLHNILKILFMHHHRSFSY